MLCPIGTKLTRELEESVRQMEHSDANMKNPRITLRLRAEDWRVAVGKVAKVRELLQEHKTDCRICAASVDENKPD